MAVRLGILHVERDILRGLTAKEIRGWEMFAELEPFDEMRQDYRVASIVQMLYNINRGKNQKAITLEECLLRFGDQEKEKQKQTPLQQFAMLKVLAAMHANDPDPVAAAAPVVPDVRNEAEQKEVENAAAVALAQIAARKAKS